jgi:hypothetical protein
MCLFCLSSIVELESFRHKKPSQKYISQKKKRIKIKEVGFFMFLSIVTMNRGFIGIVLLLKRTNMCLKAFKFNQNNFFVLSKKNFFIEYANSNNFFRLEV